MKKAIGNALPNESSKLFKEFLDSEKAGGVILIFCTVVSIFLANSGLQKTYTEIWDYSLGGHTIHYWINEGLMAIFFLLIGLELEREIYVGELSSVRKSLLPVFAAFGGMIVPSLVYLAINSGTSYSSGFGIPMATDIAFAIGILSLIKGVPVSLKVFLTGIAIVDDLGAIIIIALFYSNDIVLMNLAIALGIFITLLILNILKVNNLIPYIIGGLFMWYFMSLSGIHPTISGVLLAFAIPFRNPEKSPSYKLMHILHKPVALLILPLFALANTGIIIKAEIISLINESYIIGIIAGLVIGKPLGILSFTFLAVKLKLSSIPDKIKWVHITGIGLMAGIGFTMSIFITLLAFTENSIVNNSKISILLASIISGISGLLLLKSSFKTANGPIRSSGDDL